MLAFNLNIPKFHSSNFYFTTPWNIIFAIAIFSSHMNAILILERNLWLFWWECHVFAERFWINGFGVIPTLKRINNSRQESSDAPQNRFKPFLKFLRAFHLTKMAKMS